MLKELPLDPFNIGLVKLTRKMGSFPKMDLPGEDFINSWYPIVIALVCGLIYGIRYGTGLILVTINPSFVWEILAKTLSILCPGR